jgi:hypothetical protein
MARPDAGTISCFKHDTKKSVVQQARRVEEEEEIGNRTVSVLRKMLGNE